MAMKLCIGHLGGRGRGTSISDGKCRAHGEKDGFGFGLEELEIGNGLEGSKWDSLASCELLIGSSELWDTRISKAIRSMVIPPMSSLWTSL